MEKDITTAYVVLQPPYTRYAVSLDGEVLDLETMTHVKHGKGPNTPYIGLTLRKDNDTSRSYTIHLHRIMAFAHCENSTDLPFDKTQVNHIDGNKLNNNVDNLEIITHADNIRHAYATGLQTHRTPVVVTTPTGAVHEFIDQRTASAFLNRNPATLNEALRHGRLCAGCKIEYKE